MKIQRKVLITFCLLALVPLMVTSVTSYVLARRALTRQVLNQLESVASANAVRADAILDQREQNLRLISSRSDVRILMDIYSDHPDPIYGRKLKQILLTVKRLDPDILSISLLDRKGRIVSSSESSRDLNLPPEVFNQSDQPEAAVHWISGNETADGNEALAMYVTTPIFYRQKRLGSFVVKTANAHLIQLTQNNSGLGRSGEILLLRPAAGDFVRILTPTRFPASKVIGPRNSTDAHGATLRSLVMMDKPMLVAKAVDYRGVSVLAATQPLRRFNWLLVCKMDVDEALATVESLRIVSFQLAAGLLALVIISAVFISRSLTRPLMNLAATARAVTQGNIHERVDIRSSDEVGVLAQAFNQMTERLVNHAKELERINQELDEFARMASHDLREPLRTLGSYLQLFSRRYQGQVDEKADQWIRFMLDATTRMEALIKDLLDFARAGFGQKNFSSVAAGDILSETLSSLKVRLEETGASIRSGELPTLMADRQKLGQVFQNLISNAVKFRGSEAPKIDVEAKAADAFWEFTVRDNGIGFDPKFRDQIFGAFQRLHSMAEYPGTGMGLAICKKIIEFHGGTIWVDSTPGQGSCFHFTIPKG